MEDVDEYGEKENLNFCNCKKETDTDIVQETETPETDIPDIIQPDTTDTDKPKNNYKPLIIIGAGLLAYLLLKR